VLNPQVNQVVPFSEAASAIAAVESGHPLGKVVLQIG
jgi:NADPH:quinone reductase-like Zn-dependent oxidoreductase